MTKKELAAAVQEFQPLMDQGQTDEEIKLAMTSAGHLVEDAEQIYLALTPKKEEVTKEKPAKHKAALQFRDKTSQKVYSPGDDFTGSKERLAELEGKGYIKKV